MGVLMIHFVLIMLEEAENSSNCQTTLTEDFGDFLTSPIVHAASVLDCLDVHVFQPLKVSVRSNETICITTTVYSVPILHEVDVLQPLSSLSMKKQDDLYHNTYACLLSLASSLIIMACVIMNVLLSSIVESQDLRCAVLFVVEFYPCNSYNIESIGCQSFLTTFSTKNNSL